MARGRAKFGVLFPLLLIAMIGGGSAFVWVQTRPTPPRPQPYQGGSMGLSANFYLVPVTLDVPATTRAATAIAATTRAAGGDFAAAREAWREFIDNAGSDPEISRLVGRMYGGLPAEVVVLDPATASPGSVAMYGQPSPGNYIGVRIVSVSVQNMVMNQWQVVSPNVSVGFTLYVPDRNQTIGGPGYWPGGGNVSLDQMLSILADDYFLRHGMPWMLQYGQVNPKRFKDAAAARQDVDRRIKKMADQGEQMYGGLKPK